MKQVKDGVIVAQRLPKSGIINGATVMNYHKLPQETLEPEGWLTHEEDKPEYDSETQRLQFDYDDIQANKVVSVYKVVDKPAPTPQINDITLSADKTQITADGTDASTITATFEGVEVDTYSCYITIDGEVCETVEPITGGEVVREFTSETAKVFKLDFHADDKVKTIFVEAV